LIICLNVDRTWQTGWVDLLIHLYHVNCTESLENNDLCIIVSAFYFARVEYEENVLVSVHIKHIFDVPQAKKNLVLAHKLISR
jgi:hypothetical protein